MKKLVTLYFRKLHEDVGLPEFIDALRPFGKIDAARLGEPAKPEHKNGGWAWAKMTEEVAQHIEAATIVIRDGIIQVRRPMRDTATQW